jgi:uroporphyrinogen decarboxylase
MCVSTDREAFLLRTKPLLAALAGHRPAVPPFWLMRQAGRYLPEYRAVRGQVASFLDLCFNPELATEVTLQPVRRFATDAAILFSDILVLPFALGQAVNFVEGVGPRLDPLRSTADLTRLTREGVADRLSAVYETVGRIRRALPDPVTLIGFSGSPWTLACYMVEGGSSSDFAATRTWAYRDPAGFDALIGILTDAVIDHLSHQIAAGAEVVQLFDSWAGILPEGPFRRYVVEPTRRIAKALHHRYPQVPIIGFPRGAGLLYDLYDAESGVDAIGLDTTVPVGWAVENLAHPLQGNLDPLALLAGGEAMERAAQAIIAGFRDQPFIFNLGHGVPPQTPPEHVAALAALVRSGSSNEIGALHSSP